MMKATQVVVEDVSCFKGTYFSVPSPHALVTYSGLLSLIGIIMLPSRLLFGHIPYLEISKEDTILFVGFRPKFIVYIETDSQVRQSNQPILFLCLDIITTWKANLCLSAESLTPRRPTAASVCTYVSFTTLPVWVPLSGLRWVVFLSRLRHLQFESSRYPVRTCLPPHCFRQEVRCRQNVLFPGTW